MVLQVLESSTSISAPSLDPVPDAIDHPRTDQPYDFLHELSLDPDEFDALWLSGLLIDPTHQDVEASQHADLNDLSGPFTFEDAACWTGPNIVERPEASQAQRQIVSGAASPLTSSAQEKLSETISVQGALISRARSKKTCDYLPGYFVLDFNKKDATASEVSAPSQRRKRKHGDSNQNSEESTSRHRRVRNGAVCVRCKMFREKVLSFQLSSSFKPNSR